MPMPLRSSSQILATTHEPGCLDVCLTPFRFLLCDSVINTLCENATKGTGDAVGVGAADPGVREQPGPASAPTSDSLWFANTGQTARAVI